MHASRQSELSSKAREGTRYGASAVELLLSADCRTGQRITCSGCCVDGRTEDEQPRTPTEPPRRSTLKQVKFACQGCSSRVRCCVFECRASSSTAHRWQASAQIAASQLNAFEGRAVPVGMHGGSERGFHLPRVPLSGFLPRRSSHSLPVKYLQLYTASTNADYRIQPMRRIHTTNENVRTIHATQ